jgi:hypothetical protein
MAAIGGPIVEVTIAGRIFNATGDANGTRHLGGYKSERQPNGDGKTDRNILTPTNWYVNGVTIEMDDDRDDQQFIQNTINGGKDQVITVEYTSGAVYQGVGSVTGDHDFANESASATVNLGGPGEFTKQ